MADMKTESVTVRLPASLIASLRERAEAAGLTLGGVLRSTIETAYMDLVAREGRD